MKRSISAARVCGIVLLIALIVAGCTSSGLSPREVRGRDYAGYVYSMYDPAVLPADKNAAQGVTAGGAGAERKPLKTPAHIAVAQLGEVAPPDAMMDKLRADAATFASVQSVSALVDAGAQHVPTPRPQDHSTQQSAQSHAERMRRYAADLGADYLFLYGGTLDQSQVSTPMAAMNLTVIGAFLVPSQKLDADVKAAGSLVDVKSGRVVLSVSADGRESRTSPSIGVKASERSMLLELKHDVIEKLATQLSARVKERAAMPAAQG
jgi:hypothetical protein